MDDDVVKFGEQWRKITKALEDGDHEAGFRLVVHTKALIEKCRAQLEAVDIEQLFQDVPAARENFGK